MTVQQLFYTSCKKGLSFGMGFQTYSMSKGITEEERKEIEGYCVYIPPDNLPTQPSDKEIDELFPIAFSSFRLKTGKYCISSAKYVGKDYSGRYGNYFCHVLVSDKPWPFYPIELYGSITFRTGLTPEEENISEIQYLPELEEIHLGNSICFDSIGNFLKRTDVGKRSKDFIELMKSAIELNKTEKKIIFCDYKGNTAYWIGAVQMSLPRKLAQQFSFTTYCYNPDDASYMICAADREGSKFNFRDIQKSYKYNVFDFINGQSSDLTYNSSFIKRAEVGYTVSKETFLPFICFLDQFEYNVLDENIDNCVCLYNMVNRGVEKSTIEDVKRAVSFAVNYKSIQAYRQLFQQLDHNLEKISTQVDVELAEMITKFLFMVGRETNDSEHIRKAYEFYFNSIHYLVMDNEDINVEDILSLHERMRKIEEVTLGQFVKLSLHRSRIKELQTYLEGGKIRHAKFYFRSLISDIMAFNDKYSDGDGIDLFNIKSEDAKNITIFLNKCLSILIKSPEDILDILHTLKYEYEYFPEIIIKAYSINNYLYKDSSIEETLVGFIIEEGRIDEEWKKKICICISQLTNANDFLFSMYSIELRDESNKKEFFISYCYKVFNYFENYRKKKFSDALRLYLSLCEDGELSLEEYKEIISYIDKKSLCQYIDKDVLKIFFIELENKINVEKVALESYTIRKMFELKSECSIKTPCNIIELIYSIQKIEDSDAAFKINHLENLKVDFLNIDTKSYEKLLESFLNNLCVYLQSPSEHDKVKKALFCSEYEEIYYSKYFDVLDDIVLTKQYKDTLKSNNREAYQVFIDFLIFLFKNDMKVKEETEEYLENRIINILKESSEKKLEVYDNYFKRKVNAYKNKVEIIEKWSIIKDKAREKKQKRNPFNLFRK